MHDALHDATLLYLVLGGGGELDVVRDNVLDTRHLAVDETVILLHPPLPSVVVSIGMWRGRQQHDSLADGHRHPTEHNQHVRVCAGRPVPAEVDRVNVGPALSAAINAAVSATVDNGCQLRAERAAHKHKHNRAHLRGPNLEVVAALVRALAEDLRDASCKPGLVAPVQPSLLPRLVG